MRRLLFLSLAAVVVFTAAATPVSAQKSRKKADPPPAITPESKPCASDSYRQFDFWLGDWDVVAKDGKPAGTNHVVSLFGGCGLQENWQSANGGRGTSLNVYDIVSHRWHQTWVDDQAGLLELNGGIEDGKMVLVGWRPSVKEKGARVVHRITWTPLSPDKVEQNWEASTNEGRTWTTVFDGIYVRKK
ncbi:MAG TPA: hypothetical protein VKJ00_02995 [Thermoanaerobaculia bacterium]|nr:hypothetical protein [Thermoanaerobaculia bacterium]